MGKSKILQAFDEARENFSKWPKWMRDNAYVASASLRHIPEKDLILENRRLKEELKEAQEDLRWNWKAAAIDIARERELTNQALEELERLQKAYDDLSDLYWKEHLRK